MVDQIIRVPDASTGTNLWGVFQVVRTMIEKQQSGTIVTLMCDSGERYLDTYYEGAVWLAILVICRCIRISCHRG